MAQSKIEWTDETWNPVTGCSKCSAGCKNCYAEIMAKRLQAMGQARYANGFGVTLQRDIAKRPLSWKKPRMVFVNSMSDLFHQEIPEEYIQELFEVMKKAHWHTFQILTKRSERLAEMAQRLPWSSNIWMGVSIEDSRVLHRADDLRKVPAKVRFISAEPLIGSIRGIDLTGIDWCIVGGESGPGARIMQPMWAEEIKVLCENSDTNFFFKQWGAWDENGKRVGKKKAGRLLGGKQYDNMPEKARPLRLF